MHYSSILSCESVFELSTNNLIHCPFFKCVNEGVLIFDINLNLSKLNTWCDHSCRTYIRNCHQESYFFRKVGHLSVDPDVIIFHFKRIYCLDIKLSIQSQGKDIRIQSLAWCHRNCIDYIRTIWIWFLPLNLGNEFLCAPMAYIVSHRHNRAWYYVCILALVTCECNSNQYSLSIGDHRCCHQISKNAKLMSLTQKLHTDWVYDQIFLTIYRWIYSRVTSLFSWNWCTNKLRHWAIRIRRKGLSLYKNIKGS